ncbi:MAG: serine/threonine-protein kinase [Myxococcota bacterium]
MTSSDETQDAAVDTTGTPGQRLPARVGGRYRLDRVIGAGGMGRVVHGFDEELGRGVAIKLLVADAAGANRRARLLREAHALARLSHPNVVQLYDAGVEGDEIFIAMELVLGGTLADEVEGASWQEVLHLYLAAGRGLQAAHEAGLVHRDFKPSNVLVGRDGRPRVADFGLAAGDGEAPSRGGATADDGDRLHGQLTVDGGVVGTPRYMAPEQHEGEAASVAADQWSFCASLYEALYGVHPYDYGRAGWKTRMCEGGVVKPKVERGPTPLRAALIRGLQPRPTDRHGSLAQLLPVLERTLAYRRRRAWTALGVAAGLAIGGAAFAMGSADAISCTAGVDMVRRVWSRDDGDAGTPRRVALVAAVDPAVVQVLDDYALDWSQAHERACRKAQAGELTEAAHVSTDACLRRRLLAIDATVDALTAEGELSADQAADAVSRLRPVSRCEVDALSSVETPGPDDAIAGAVDEARNEEARAEAWHAAGQRERALEALDAVERELESLGYGPARAELSLLRARLAMDRMDWPVAAAHLASASSLALGDRADLVAAEAAARAVFVDAIRQGPAAVTAQDVDLARAYAKRVGRPLWLAALLENNVGVWHALAGDTEAADLSFGRAIELASQSSDIAPVDEAGYLVNVALRTPAAAERNARFDEALRLAQDALGRRHARTLEISVLRARSTVDDSMAASSLAPSCSAYADRGALDWSQCHSCYWALSLMQPEDVRDEAIQASTLCLESAELEVQAGLEWQTRRAMADAMTAAREGDVERTREATARARDLLGSLPDAPWVDAERADLTLIEAEAAVRSSERPAADLRDALQDAKRVFATQLEASNDQQPARRIRRADRLLTRLAAD